MFPLFLEKIKCRNKNPPQYYNDIEGVKIGTWAGIRTLDQLVKSQLLYRLSYPRMTPWSGGIKQEFIIAVNNKWEFLLYFLCNRGKRGLHNGFSCPTVFT